MSLVPFTVCMMYRFSARMRWTSLTGPGASTSATSGFVLMLTLGLPAYFRTLDVDSLVLHA